MKNVLFRILPCIISLSVILFSCGSNDVTEDNNSMTVEIEKITLDINTLSMFIGDEQSLHATCVPENTTDRVIRWASSDNSVASVDNQGLVKAVSSGDAVITASSGNGNVKAICTVNVSAYSDDDAEYRGGKNDGIQLNVNKLRHPQGTMEVLKAQPAPEYSGKKVIWMSSDTGVVKVNENGLITCGNKGEAYVVAQIENTDKTDTCYISVVNIDGEVIWYGDPTKEFYSSFYNVSKEGDSEYTAKDGTIKAINHPDYGKIWEVHKPAYNKRCEFSRTEARNTDNSYEIKSGDRVYVGWRVMMDVRSEVKPGPYLQFQLKTGKPQNAPSGVENGWQNHPVSIDFDSQNSQLIVSGIYPVDKPDASVSNRITTFCKAEMKELEWTDIVMGFNFSDDPETSFVEVWVNGVRQLLTDRNGNKVFKAHHRTIDFKADNSGHAHMYFKWGVYNKACAPYDVYGYFDEMRVGKTLKDVINPLLQPIK